MMSSVVSSQASSIRSPDCNNNSNSPQSQERIQLAALRRPALRVSARAMRVSCQRRAEAEHRQVLARLRHHPVVCGDAEHVAVDPGGAGDHVTQEALMPRHVHQRQPPPGGQREWRESELDRDAARLLGGQAVGVATGEGQHEGRLAVVDVPAVPSTRGSPSMVRA